MVAQRFCDRTDAHLWIESSIGRVTCERVLSCLSLISAPSNFNFDDTAGTGVGSTDSKKMFPWLHVAVNGPELVKVVTRIVQHIDDAAGDDDRPCRVKKYD